MHGHIWTHVRLYILATALLLCMQMNFHFIGGPTVDPNMTLTVLSSRDTTPNVQFRLVFNVSFGLPSRILCNRNTTTIIHKRGIVPGVDYEIVRPLHVHQ